LCSDSDKKGEFYKNMNNFDYLTEKRENPRWVLMRQSGCSLTGHTKTLCSEASLLLRSQIYLEWNLLSKYMENPIFLLNAYWNVKFPVSSGSSSSMNCSSPSIMNYRPYNFQKSYYYKPPSFSVL